jgi:hypothetical protein
MATEKQIAANRGNAAKSTGPRTTRGKKRVGRNALRHGLSLGLPYTHHTSKHLDQRAHEIAGECGDQVTLGYARVIAEADLDLARVRQVKVAVIAHVSAFGARDPARLRSKGIMRSLKQYDEADDSPLSSATEARPPAMPSELERSAETIRRALPELLKLDRYERRAAARRDRAVRRICERRKHKAMIVHI